MWRSWMVGAGVVGAGIAIGLGTGCGGPGASGGDDAGPAHDVPGDPALDAPGTDAPLGSDGGAVDAPASFSCDDCALGCDASRLACEVPAISNVTPDYLEGATAHLTIRAGASVELDTDTGAITGVRPGDTGIAEGVGFFPGSGASPSVLTVDRLTIEAGATLRLRGARPLAILASHDVVIEGTLDASGGCADGSSWCAGPGGGAGGRTEADVAVNASGCGPGTIGFAADLRTDVGVLVYDTGGGGGGAFGQAGASGNATTSPGLGGGGGVDGCGDGTLVPLHGGSGGAAGGRRAPGAFGATGGGGGGAVQLVSLTRIDIGEGGAVLASGAGGAGGPFLHVFPGSRGSYRVGIGGGGGGAGGGILIEAPVVSIDAGGVVAANGGGGGGSSTTETTFDGEDGRSDATPAAGGDPGSDCAATGQCGPGGDGGSAEGAPTVGGNGGGGGGAGVIHIRALATGLAIAGGAVISPPHTTALLSAR